MVRTGRDKRKRNRSVTYRGAKSGHKNCKAYQSCHRATRTEANRGANSDNRRKFALSSVLLFSAWHDVFKL